MVNIMTIETFTNGIFGDLHVIRDLDDSSSSAELWFIGNEVAGALGYSNAGDALKKHTHPDDRISLSFKEFKGFSPNAEANGLGFLWQDSDYANKTIINESGLYCMIFASKVDGALRFKHWVTREVLPSVRKNGGYIYAQETLPTPIQEEVKKNTKNLAEKVQILKTQLMTARRLHKAAVKTRDEYKVEVIRLKKELACWKSEVNDIDDRYSALLDEMITLQAEASNLRTLANRDKMLGKNAAVTKTVVIPTEVPDTIIRVDASGFLI